MIFNKIEEVDGKQYEWLDYPMHYCRVVHSVSFPDNLIEIHVSGKVIVIGDGSIACYNEYDNDKIANGEYPNPIWSYENDMFTGLDISLKENLFSWNSGGGCIIDRIVFDNFVLEINDESVVIWENEEKADECEADSLWWHLVRKY